MNTLHWKRLFSRYYPLLRQRSRKIILLYHSIGDGPWAVSENAFRDQIEWLKNNCDILPIDDLLKSKNNKNKPEVAITFDDGYASLYQTAFPILQSKNITATVYLSAGCISDSDSKRQQSNQLLGHYLGETFLIWDEVRLLEKNGWEIGSHGVNHIDLTMQSNATIKTELNLSKEKIENKLGKICRHFAYTFAKHDKKIRNEVASAGYQYAAAAQHSRLKKNSDPFVLPRLNIDKNYTLEDFKNIVLGKWDFIGIVHYFKGLQHS
ncbi:MAG: hypothetical protein A3F12_00725 [Gammaproteobacteria bacterium RIFCSPHIGHO2_12_FULL_38_14]|nr:MAG: hypothetical protein A3F12_00725 [Gammaproteobacteria bacterium RIFCSPHIGHO2_12_FULL_38_14]